MQIVQEILGAITDGHVGVGKQLVQGRAEAITICWRATEQREEQAAQDTAEVVCLLAVGLFPGTCEQPQRRNVTALQKCLGGRVNHGSVTGIKQQGPHGGVDLLAANKAAEFAAGPCSIRPPVGSGQ
ncbi:hypothetical protein ABT297_39745 [Dactylosporangium sp. NPDC000555]|uniref:hypothetical protein n=1 Tax=Dactylosporangium sp. NPDC000555 TaxID=3154260 RepID=UPI00332ABCEF